MKGLLNELLRCIETTNFSNSPKTVANVSFVVVTVGTLLLLHIVISLEMERAGGSSLTITGLLLFVLLVIFLSIRGVYFREMSG